MRTHRIARIFMALVLVPSLGFGALEAATICPDERRHKGKLLHDSDAGRMWNRQLSG